MRRQFLVAASTAMIVIACSGQASLPGASDDHSHAASPSVVAASPTADHAVTSPSPTASTANQAGSVAYEGQIDVGNGRTLEVRCVGTGTPTILLEGGGIDPSLDAYPDAFVQELGKTTTACHYSRAGGGASSPPAGARTMAGMVDDAYAMLAALEREANVQGPYVFVGWSFGGTVALAEALAHPDQTVGLVILDTGSQTNFMTTCLASGRTQADCQEDYDGDMEAKALGDEVVANMHPLRDIPLRLVTAMQQPSCSTSDPSSLRADLNGRIVVATDCADLARIYSQDERDGWSIVNPKLEQTEVDADHDGLIFQSGDQISTIILDIVRAVRESG